MQLNITTDYAIRIVIYLATTNQLTVAKEISDNMVIPQNYVIKIMKKLKDAGIVETYNGVNGGYKLRKSADEISLLDIIKIMEKTIMINRCLEADEYCSRNAIKECSMRKYYINIQNLLESKLKDITIKDCINN